MSSRSPELVCGRYRVTGKHGASAGFEVLNAIDPGRPGVRVRVVVVPSAGEAQASLIVQQTRRYAIAPGVVTAAIGELGAPPGGQALAFELGTGKLLDELIAERALETRAALALIEGAARALATLHDQGVAHGLVDKALIGVEAGGRVVLGGYGVVQLTRSPGSTLGDDRIALSALAGEMLNASLATGLPSGLEFARALEAPNDAKDLIEWAKGLGAAFREQLPPIEVVPEAPVEVSKTPPAVVMPNPPAPPLAAAPRQPSGWPIAAAVAVSFVLLFGVVVGLFAHRLLTSKAASAPSASAGPTAAAPVTAAPSAEVTPVPAPDPALPDPSAAPRRAPPLPPARQARDRVNSAASSAAAALPIAPTTPTTEASEALVSALVFGDLECPHTRRLYRSLTELTRLYAGDLRLAWRHRPLREHGHARQAALFAAAVHEQDGAVAFWRLVADLSRSEDAADPLWLGNWATRQGRAFPEFRAPRDSSGAVAQVDDDVALANRFGVRETPTLFVNGLRVRGDRPFDELRATVETELRVSRALLAAGISPNDLYATHVSKNLIGIGPDVVDRACPPLARSPRRGAPEPLVTLVVFANFQCPFCRRVQPTLKQLETRYANQLSIVWKHLPLSQHPNAGSAARLALVARERAGDPGFWRVHDLLFAVDPPLDAAGLAGVAEQAGLDARALNAARRGDHQAEIEADIALAKRLGVSGTPTFFVNGRRLGGAQPFSSFDTLIREELEAARRMIGRGVPPEALYAALCGDP